VPPYRWDAGSARIPILRSRPGIDYTSNQFNWRRFSHFSYPGRLRRPRRGQVWFFRVSQQPSGKRSSHVPKSRPDRLLGSLGADRRALLSACFLLLVQMAGFHTILKSARFIYPSYTAIEMQGFAQVLADSIRARIQSGQNISVKPELSGRRGYPDYKAARRLQPIRDWTWTGHTLRCLKVLPANENRAAIGFLNEARPGQRLTASQIAASTTGAGRSGASRRIPSARPFVMLKAA